LVFDYVEAFVDELESYERYKELDAIMADMRSKVQCQGRWPSAEEVAHLKCPRLDFEATDFAAQLICGAGWRVVDQKKDENERSIIISAPGNNGARFVVTTSLDENSRVARFIKSTGRQGIGALAFRLDAQSELETIRHCYQSHHPALIVQEKNTNLDTYAYYQSGSLKIADIDRARLRFTYYDSSPPPTKNEEVRPWSMRGISDHWVSNVADREQFLATLGDVAGLSPRVEFDAGVIAAGKASIESTVLAGDHVFLPANNALSPYGHVAAFLQQMGQGVQHIATRVDDLIAFVATAKVLRQVTGIGFQFLDVPRAYYGYLNSADTLAKKAHCDPSQAERALEIAKDLQIIDNDGIIHLDANATNLLLALEKDSLFSCDDERQRIVDSLLFYRYSNIFKVLGDRLQPEEYVEIVRNRILVDKQGDDALLQIFTTNILQRKPSEEAPFLEFIQRICDVDDQSSNSLDPPRFGCGGFGIRNFLTLFLSIELNSALTLFRNTDTPAAKHIAKLRLDCLTEQLDVSSDVLATISDASAEEAQLSSNVNDPRLQDAQRRKAQAQSQLQSISAEYAARMSDIDSLEQSTIPAAL